MSQVHEESPKMLAERLRLLIEENREKDLVATLFNVHPADLGDVFGELEEEERAHLFQLLDDEQATDLLAELSADLFSELIQTMAPRKKRAILENMGQDDIVDMLGDLPEERRHEIIRYLDIDDARDVRELLIYEEDSAGGIMTKDFVVLKVDNQIGTAIETLRNTAPDAETIYYVFVVNDEGKLEGVISLRQLIVSKPEILVGDVMNHNVITAKVDDDQEEVARLVSKYDLLAIPVVDDRDILLGIITVDDVIDVIEEEATEDIFKFAGSSDLEDFDDEPLSHRIRIAVRSRLPWLIVTIFGGLMSANVIARYQVTLDANTTLALFMPILAGMGGNVGTQSSTITVRSIAVNNLQGKAMYQTLVQEIAVGLLVGMVCSLIVAGAAILLEGQLMLSVIVGLAMWANMLTASTIGTVVPLVFKRVGVDPAVASAPFITTTIDITGLTIYFTLATAMMTQLM